MLILPHESNIVSINTLSVLRDRSFGSKLVKKNNVEGTDPRGTTQLKFLKKTLLSIHHNEPITT